MQGVNVGAVSIPPSPMLDYRAERAFRQQESNKASVNSLEREWKRGRENNRNQQEHSKLPPQFWELSGIFARNPFST